MQVRADAVRRIHDRDEVVVYFQRFDGAHADALYVRLGQKPPQDEGQRRPFRQILAVCAQVNARQDELLEAVGNEALRLGYDGVGLTRLQAAPRVRDDAVGAEIIAPFLNLEVGPRMLHCRRIEGDFLEFVALHDVVHGLYRPVGFTSQQLSDAQTEVDGILKDLSDSEAGQNLQTKLDELNDAITAAEQAAGDVEKALGELAGTEAAQTAAEALRTELTAIYASLGDAKTAVQEIGAAAAKLVLPSVDTGELEAARQEAQAAGDSLSSALRALKRCVDSGEDAVRQLRELLEQAGDVMDGLQKAGDTMEELASLTSDLSEDLCDVLHELSEMPTITIHPISSEIQEQGDALGTGQAAAEKRRQDQQRADQRKHRQIECERTVDPEQLPTLRDGERGQRGGHPGDQCQVQKIGPDHIAERKRAVPLGQRSDGGGKLRQRGSERDKSQRDDALRHAERFGQHGAMVNKQIRPEGNRDRAGDQPQDGFPQRSRGLLGYGRVCGGRGAHLAQRKQQVNRKGILLTNFVMEKRK